MSDKIMEKYGAEIDDLTNSLTAEDLLCAEEISDMQVPPRQVRAINCNMGAYYAMKHNWLQYFMVKAAKGYYKGNLAIARCRCGTIIDAWPCKEKRDYTMRPKHCPLCSKERTAMTARDYMYYKHMQPRRNFVQYIVNHK